MHDLSFRSLSEEQLAAFQTAQHGNNCTLHAISAALDLLCGVRLPPAELIRQTDRLWWHGHFFRLAPGWAVPPLMQARLVNYLATSYSLPVRARKFHLSPEILHGLAGNESLLALVTLYWLPGHAPAIYYGRDANNLNATGGMGAHTMLFAAYDPSHFNAAGSPSPWGFVNSWVEQGSSLYWMTDRDFKRGWGFPIPWLANHAAVIISKTTEEVTEI